MGRAVQMVRAAAWVGGGAVIVMVLVLGSLYDAADNPWDWLAVPFKVVLAWVLWSAAWKRADRLTRRHGDQPVVEPLAARWHASGADDWQMRQLVEHADRAGHTHEGWPYRERGGTVVCTRCQTVVFADAPAPAGTERR